MKIKIDFNERYDGVIEEEVQTLLRPKLVNINGEGGGEKVVGVDSYIEKIDDLKSSIDINSYILHEWDENKPPEITIIDAIKYGTLTHTVESDDDIIFISAGHDGHNHGIVTISITGSYRTLWEYTPNNAYTCQIKIITGAAGAIITVDNSYSANRYNYTFIAKIPKEFNYTRALSASSFQTGGDAVYSKNISDSELNDSTSHLVIAIGAGYSNNWVKSDNSNQIVYMKIFNSNSDSTMSGNGNYSIMLGLITKNEDYYGTESNIMRAYGYDYSLVVLAFLPVDYIADIHSEINK